MIFIFSTFTHFSLQVIKVYNGLQVIKVIKVYRLQVMGYKKNPVRRRRR